MKSQHAKKELLNFFLYEKKRTLCMTEFKYADVFTLTASEYTEEIEIKVEKGDLKRELEVVSWATGMGPEKAFAWNKKHKHQRYMEAAGKRDVLRNGYTMAYPRFEDVPNRFYFAVTSELRELAERGVHDTPYGLIILTQTEEGPPERKRVRVEIIKAATNLHGLKTDGSKLVPLMRKVCTENLALMEKAYAI